MFITRRTALAGLAAAPAALSLPSAALAATTLKISHQFPGGTIDQGDFRDRLCRTFAKKVEEATKGDLKFDIYPNSSLMKTIAQFSAIRKGALDMTLYPLCYAGGEIHEANISLMPSLVTDYQQGMKWREAEVGQLLSKILEAKGVKIISWIWQGGGVASRTTPIRVPDDVKGIKIRGGSAEMDRMLTACGGIVSTAPSNEMYLGMQTGSLGAAVSSSTSLISFRLNELAKAFTSGRTGAFWFVLEPLLMSKDIFDGLNAQQQKIILDVGREMEVWGIAEAKKDDQEAANVYGAKGATIIDLSSEDLAKWRKVSEDSAWKDFAGKTTTAAELLKLAQKIS